MISNQKLNCPILWLSLSFDYVFVSTSELDIPKPNAGICGSSSISGHPLGNKPSS